MRTHLVLLAVAVVVPLLLLPAHSWAQGEGDDLGLGALGLGDLGSLGALGGLGNLGGMAGGLGALGQLGNLQGLAGQQAAPTIIVNQPTMLAVGDYLYIADNGTITKLKLSNLQKVAQAQYASPQARTAQALDLGLGGPRRPRKAAGASQGDVQMETAAGGAVPPLVSGATPAPAP